MNFKALSTEVKTFCATQYKKGCGSCFMHQICTERYLLTIDSLNDHTERINKEFSEKS